MSVDPTDCPQCSGFHPNEGCWPEEDQFEEEDQDEVTYWDCGGYSPDTLCGTCKACNEERAEQEELYGAAV